MVWWKENRLCFHHTWVQTPLGSLWTSDNSRKKKQKQTSLAVKSAYTNLTVLKNREGKIAPCRMLGRVQYMLMCSWSAKEVDIIITHFCISLIALLVVQLRTFSFYYLLRPRPQCCLLEIYFLLQKTICLSLNNFVFPLPFYYITHHNFWIAINYQKL